jgi:hypothetical protein
MKTFLNGAALLQGLLLLAFAGIAHAQDDADAMYVYATYLVCDTSQQDRADEIFEKIDQPLLDAAVADKSLSGYSYYTHHTGGRWRRGTFSMAPSIQALLDSQETIGAGMTAGNSKMRKEFNTICNAHDDYIWSRVAGKTRDGVTGGAVFSTYYVCDSREVQADAIVEQVFAPAYDKLVDDGKLTSWAYLEHIVGGKFRRVWTMSAVDMKSLVAARTALTETVMDNPLSDTFTDICDSHDDYMWEVTASGGP